MKDEDIDTSDNPELGEEFFKNAVWWSDLNKPITRRLDPAVIYFFLKQGKNYKAAINRVLRKHVQQQKQAFRPQRQKRRAR